MDVLSSLLCEKEVVQNEDYLQYEVFILYVLHPVASLPVLSVPLQGSSFPSVFMFEF
jgi:hypothetical protein